MKFAISENALLLDALSQKYPNSSKSSLRNWIKEGRVTIDEMPVKLANHPYLAGNAGGWSEVSNGR